MIDPRTAARALGGDVVTGGVLAPGPGHKPTDRSLSIKFDPNAPDGFVVNSFAGDDPMLCRDDVKARLDLPSWRPDVDRMPTASARLNRDGWACRIPAPGDATPPPGKHPNLGRPLKRWVYRDATGATLGFVARFDRADGSKEFRPLTFWTNSKTNRSEWRFEAWPSPRPLYGLDRLAARPSDPVLVVEGEKACDAAGRLLPDVVAVTSPNGSKSAGKADWSPLAGRRVLVWPDADQPGAAYAADVARLAREAGATSVAVLAPPEGTADGWDAADASSEGWDQSRAEAFVATAKPVTAEPTTPLTIPSSWLRPDLSVLATSRRPAPAFDVSVLGERMAEWVIVTAAATWAPVDYIATALLSLAGAAIANVRWPLAGAAWSEPPVLWCGLVGDPSSGKSPAQSAVVELVRDLEQRMAEDHEAALREFETAKVIAEATRERWEAEAAAALKNGDKPPFMPIGAEVPDEPVRARLIVSDSTTERLAILAAGIPRGLILTRDELAGWMTSFGRYGGGGSDRAFAIEMYGGRHYRVDRAKHPKSIEIENLSVGVVGTIQPERLSDALDGPDDGLAARFLWSWPDQSGGFEISHVMPSTAVAKRALERLVALPMGADDRGVPRPVRVPLDRMGENYLEAFAREMLARAKDATGVFAGTLGKARGHVLRLSCVLEYLKWAASDDASAPTTISAKSVEDACDLVEAYFLPMAERAFGDAAIPKAERLATVLARHLRDRRGTTFNARDVRRDVGGLLRESSDMDTACGELVEAGLIRPVEDPRGGPGRKAKTFEINPALRGAS